MGKGTIWCEIPELELGKHPTPTPANPFHQREGGVFQTPLASTGMPQATSRHLGRRLPCAMGACQAEIDRPRGGGSRGALECLSRHYSPPPSAGDRAGTDVVGAWSWAEISPNMSPVRTSGAFGTGAPGWVWGGGVTRTLESANKNNKHKTIALSGAPKDIHTFLLERTDKFSPPPEKKISSCNIIHYILCKTLHLLEIHSHLFPPKKIQLVHHFVEIQELDGCRCNCKKIAEKFSSEVRENSDGQWGHVCTLSVWPAGICQGVSFATKS